MNNRDITNHLISPELQIKSLIKILGKLGSLKKNNFCLVVGKRRNILGTVTDGDIRRGLLQNYSINDKVEKIYKKRPLVTRKTLSRNEIKNILNKKGITFLPLVNKKNEILDIYDSKKVDKVSLNKDIIKHLISPEQQIKSAIKKLGMLGRLKKNNFCLVVGKRRNILGTVTDGDIRRGLLQNYSINDKVEKIYKKRPLVTRKTLSRNEIKNILNKKGITFLPLVNKKNEILDIYDSKKVDKVSLTNCQMLIMAGGKGLRLRPLTNKIPKPLLLVNKKPIIEHIITIAKSQGIIDFYISINYLGHKIKKYLGNGSKLGVKITYLEEKKPLGTAGSINLIKKFNRPIIVTNSDIISKINYKEMINAHKKNKSQLTMVAKVFYEKDSYGRILANGSVVKKVIEKLEQNLLINAGIYLIDPKIKKIIKNSEYLDMTDLINRALKKKLKINVFPIHEEWLDYGLNKKKIK